MQSCPSSPPPLPLPSRPHAPPSPLLYTLPRDKKPHVRWNQFHHTIPLDRMVPQQPRAAGDDLPPGTPSGYGLASESHAYLRSREMQRPQMRLQQMAEEQAQVGG
jgi:hypothetical protein